VRRRRVRATKSRAGAARHDALPLGDDDLCLYRGGAIHRISTLRLILANCAKRCRTCRRSLFKKSRRCTEDAISRNRKAHSKHDERECAVDLALQIKVRVRFPWITQSSASCRRCLRYGFCGQPGRRGTARRHVASSICLAKRAVPKAHSPLVAARSALTMPLSSAARETARGLRFDLPPHRGRARGKPGDR